MSHDNTTGRANKLFITEDWKKIFQTFENADFQSYDFETLRKTMTEYLQEFYPEDFNDFIESSEYVALIDLIAFLGQSLAFRTDLNARENFLATAERRDSILRLAELISYKPKRSKNAKGLLKLTSVATTESVIDSSNINLADTEILWNDPNNSDFLEQFTLILNAAMLSNQRFGKAAAKDTIDGIRTEQYDINTQSGVLSVYPFNATVNGRSTNFEIVPATFINAESIYEATPNPNSPYSLVYRNDGKGNNSANTGFFGLFKQGSLESYDFTLAQAIPNVSVEVAYENISHDDVWLYSLDNNTNELDSEWTKVEAITGQNIVFNSLSQNIRDLYSVQTGDNDIINLVFADGIFANIPRGQYRSYVRTTNNLTYTIDPNEMRGLTIDIPYVSRSNKLQTLTLTYDLVSRVDSAVTRETLSEIKERAPQGFYASNRMVSGEDYNTYPLANTQEIVKVKAINRVSSGISRFLDVRDTTARYSSTNIFAEDGMLYQDEKTDSFIFEFINDSDIQIWINNTIEPIIQSKEKLHYYYNKFPQIDYNLLPTEWTQSTKGNNVSTGFFTDGTNPQSISTFTSNDRKYLRENSLVRFTAPTGKYFKDDGSLQTGTPTSLTDTLFVWATLTNVVDEGTNQGLGAFSNGTGPVTLNDIIPTGAIIDKVIAPLVTDLPAAFEALMLTKIKNHNDFGLGFDRESQEWYIINEVNLNKTGVFSLNNAKDVSSLGLDASWLLKFESDGTTFTTSDRKLEYIFESDIETRFFFDSSLKVFDPKTGLTIKDHVKVLKVNSQPDANTALDDEHLWQIYDTVLETDGVEDSRKVKVTFFDSDDDGVVDNPDQFTTIVDPTVNPTTKNIFFELYLDADFLERYRPIPTSTVNASFASAGDEGALSQYLDGQIFYFTTDKTFGVYSEEDVLVTISTEYKAYIGRNDIKFQYRHNTSNNRRIDPSASNIIDMFILTKAYDTDYRNYIADTTGTVTEPVITTSSQLAIQFASFLNVKSISDEIIFQPVTFKPLFGSLADLSLQATFKVIKNDAVSTTDEEIKSRVLQATGDYFSTDNFDFGDTFYFSELAAYLHNELVPLISSIVIVPNSGSLSFGAMYQVTSSPDEIFVSALRAENIQIISSITQTNLRATGSIT